MSENANWQAAFLAVSTLLGESQDVAAAALGEAGARELVGAPGVTSRQARAAVVARTVAGLLAELERARLA